MIRTRERTLPARITKLNTLMLAFGCSSASFKVSPDRFPISTA